MKVVVDKRKCPKHNQWMRKGHCSICYLEKLLKQKELEKEIGSNKPDIQIKKI